MKNIDIIKERRSIHTFQSKEIPMEILENIFTYASYAPTHYMKEPWEIKLYQGKGKHQLISRIIESYQRLGMIASNQDKKTLQTIQSIYRFLDDIPHHALIYFPRNENPVRYEEDYAAVSAFIQNAQLAAWEHGVGMLWTITPYMHDPLFVSSVQLNSDHDKIAAVMQIGYPKKIPLAKDRTPIHEKLEIVDSLG